MGERISKRRVRRVQLAVPGSNWRMMESAARSKADHVFCDLEDAVAPNAKEEARELTAKAISELDWGKKTLCVRVNDIETPHCFQDILAMVQAGGRLETIMLPKARQASDVQFAATLLNQAEAHYGRETPLGLELLIEEVEGLQNVEAIACASPRVESLIFGMGDYSAAQQMDLEEIGGSPSYEGDVFHYPRFRMTAAARASGIDAIDGPFANFRDEQGYRREGERAARLGMDGKWAIHPSQIEPALAIFTPPAELIASSRKRAKAYEKAQKEGLGAVQIDGVMVDAASMRIINNILAKAELMGL